MAKTAGRGNAATIPGQVAPTINQGSGTPRRPPCPARRSLALAAQLRSSGPNALVCRLGAAGTGGVLVNSLSRPFM